MAAPTALVVGGTGPSGSAIVRRLLDRGYDVALLHTGAHEREFDRPVRHLHGDPRELSELRRLVGREEFDVAVSTSGRIRHVVEALRGRVGRLVAISGLPAYRGAMPGRANAFPRLLLPLRETDPVTSDPETRHGYMTARGEETVLDAHARGDFDAVVLRYTMVYGPHAYIPFEWYFARRALDGRREVALESDGLMAPQRGYVENLAAAVMLSIEVDAAAGEVFNVGDERCVTVRTLAEIVAGALDHSFEFVGVPMSASPCGNPLTNRQTTIYDMSKPRQLLGYRDEVGTITATRLTARWLADNRPTRDGPEERALGEHAFDYGREDAVIEAYRDVRASPAGSAGG